MIYVIVLIVVILLTLCCSSIVVLLGKRNSDQEQSRNQNYRSLSNQQLANDRGLYYDRNGIKGYLDSAGDLPLDYVYGVGLYISIWPLVSKPLTDFQIGLPSTWLVPDNIDNDTTSLCPFGTLARDTMDDRAPTYEHVFQTIEGGLGYWNLQKFTKTFPKFSINTTPDCYNTEIATSAWSFFHGKLLPNKLGLAQLSNRLLLPPDGLSFVETIDSVVLGYSYMALPLMHRTSQPYYTGENCWTLFLNTVNFNGPVAFFVPETWSKVSGESETDHRNFMIGPGGHGRGFDTRLISSETNPSASMEINSVPRFTKKYNGKTYSRIPPLQFSTNNDGESVLIHDVQAYSSRVLFGSVKQWRDGKGRLPSSVFAEEETFKPTLRTSETRYTLDNLRVVGMEDEANKEINHKNQMILKWSDNRAINKLPQFFVKNGSEWQVISETDVPDETNLKGFEFQTKQSNVNEKYSILPLSGPWSDPGPSKGPYTIHTLDGTKVTYYWYKFIDQPVFQQYANRTTEEMQRLQTMVEEIHTNWTIDKTYMVPRENTSLVTIDPNLIIVPPRGMEVGYVPVVVEQSVS